MLGELSESEDFPGFAKAAGGGDKQLTVCATLVRLLESAAVCSLVFTHPKHDLSPDPDPNP